MAKKTVAQLEAELQALQSSYDELKADKLDKLESETIEKLEEKLDELTKKLDEVEKAVGDEEDSAVKEQWEAEEKRLNEAIKALEEKLDDAEKAAKSDQSAPADVQAILDENAKLKDKLVELSLAPVASGSGGGLSEMMAALPEREDCLEDNGGRPFRYESHKAAAMNGGIFEHAERLTFYSDSGYGGGMVRDRIKDMVDRAVPKDVEDFSEWPDFHRYNELQIVIRLVPAKPKDKAPKGD